MKDDEIKEKLKLIDGFFNKAWACDLDEVYHAVIDTITNLQQENERLKVKYKEEKSHQINYNYFETLYSKSTKEIVIDDLVWKCEELDNLKKEYEKLYIEKEDYKSRCEKAVEYIEKCQLGVDSMDRPVMLANEEEGKNLLNILNGGSDE